MIKFTIHLERPAHQARKTLEALKELAEPVSGILFKLMETKKRSRAEATARRVGPTAGRPCPGDYSEPPYDDDCDGCDDPDCPDRDDDDHGSRFAVPYGFGGWGQRDDGCMVLTANGGDGDEFEMLRIVIPPGRFQGMAIDTVRLALSSLGIEIPVPTQPPPKVDSEEDDESEVH